MSELIRHQFVHSNQKQPMKANTEKSPCFEHINEHSTSNRTQTAINCNQTASISDVEMRNTIYFHIQHEN